MGITLSLAVLLSLVSAFKTSVPVSTLNRLKIRQNNVARFLSDEENAGEEPAMTAEEDKPELKFDMNRRVRLGRSRDQDGKSNIWSIEPTMEVVDEDGENQGQKNLVIAGAVIGAAIACLPLFSAFSKL